MNEASGNAVRASPTPPEEPLPPVHPSSMAQRLGWLHRRLSRWAFSFVHVDPRFVERVRLLSERGTVVFVLRHRSVADYLLVNSVFSRERLALPEFANDLAIGWFRPLRWIMARAVERLSRLDVFGGGRLRRLADRDTAKRLASAGRPILVFLSTKPTGLGAGLHPERVRPARRIGDPYLEDLLAVGVERPVYLVPLAPFRGRGYRKRSSRFSTLVYSVQEAPSELKKLLTFLFNRRDLSLTVGEEIDLRVFVDRYGAEGPARTTRRLARALHLFLYREERVVWGPPLLPKQVVREVVLGGSDLRRTIDRVAADRNAPLAKVRREAEGYFDEIASNFNGTYFALLAFVFRRIWNRMFRGVEIDGLDRVAETLRRHPVVLVPCHRSHFDYLILSYIFHSQFLSPPHIAAGINLSFFPMGMLFRGAGAFFIRRTFADNDLYKAVFRQYLAYLIREGYTQEFFIEGGRSRTGKILTPKLGMLSAIVSAFLGGARRDLYLVPVAITYERLVEEEAYKRELLGAAKEKESLGALFRARSVLQTNYGKAFVSFAEPISLAHAAGALRVRCLRSPEAPGLEEEKRRFTLKLGFRLLADVNRVTVVGAPSIAATVLLSNPAPAIRAEAFLRAAHLLLAHAEREGAHFSGSLRQDREAFRETLAFLESSGSIVRLEDGEGEILQVPDEKRLNLDFYKNNSVHLFVLPSLVSHALLRGVAAEEMTEKVWWWLDLLRNEFVLPERETLAGRIRTVLEATGARGVEGRHSSEAAPPFVAVAAPILQNFREAYWVAAKTVRSLAAEGVGEANLLERMRCDYRAALLLGVLRKPEGNTTVTLQNALERLRELGCVRRDEGGARGASRVFPGPEHSAILQIERRLAEEVTTPGSPF